MELSVKYGLLPFKYVVLEELSHKAVKAYPVNGNAKALAGNALFTIYQQSLFDYAHHLVLGEYPINRGAAPYGFAPLAAKVYAVAALILLNGVKGAFVYALAAVVAYFPIQHNGAVLVLYGVYGAALHRDTFFAGVAHILVKRGYGLAYYAKVVKVRLNTVVGAAAHAYLELMRQLYGMPALVEYMVYLLGQRLGVVKAVYAHGTLAGHYRAHYGACAAGNESGLADELGKCLYILIFYAWQLNGEPCCEGDLAIAELFGSFGYTDTYVLEGGSVFNEQLFE